MDNIIKLDGKNWKVKLEERNRGKMKLTFKLNTKESEAYMQWKATVMPDGITEQDFLKQVFFRGIEALTETIRVGAAAQLQDPNIRQQLEGSGINVSALEERLKG